MTPLTLIAVGSELYLVDDGYQDGGLAFDVLAEPLPIAPGGADGEAVYHTLYVVLTHTMGCTLRLTPIVDDVEKATIDVVLAAQANRTKRILEIALSEPYVDPVTGLEEMRQALRGQWFTCRLETTGGVGDGVLILNGVVVETEVVRESLVAENAG